MASGTFNVPIVPVADHDILLRMHSRARVERLVRGYVRRYVGRPSREHVDRFTARAFERFLAILIEIVSQFVICVTRYILRRICRQLPLTCFRRKHTRVSFPARIPSGWKSFCAVPPRQSDFPCKLRYVGFTRCHPSRGPSVLTCNG